MPTRSYKLRVKSNKSQKVQQVNAEPGEDASVEPKTNPPSAKKRRFIRSAENELDRLMMHTTDDLIFHERHSMLTAFNVGRAPLQSLDELCVYPGCELSMPRAIYVADKHCERVDICHRRTMARYIYRKRLHNARTRYQTVQKNKASRSDVKKGIYHASLFDLARRLENDPDPFFHGSYDYYYTGGNLTVLPDDGLVVHVDGAELNNLNIGSFSSTYRNHYLSTNYFHQLDPANEIFEVRPVRSLNGVHQNCFAVRQRNSITLRHLHPNGKIKSLMQFKTKYTPFISFAQSPHNSYTFLVTTMKQSVRIYDLNRGPNSLRDIQEVSARGENTRISWNMVKPWHGQTFLYANEQKLFLMDLRTGPAEWLKSSCGRSETTFECDSISSVAKSEFRNLAYVATSHKLHCLDMRYLGHDLENGDGALCCWTHQLEYAPAFLDTFRNAGAEFIAMSSALADDLHICELTREHHIKEATVTCPDDVPRQLKKCVYKSVCLPYKPSTLEEAYQNARMSGKCLQPDADLKTRMQRCITGLSFYDTEMIDATDETSGETLALLLTANSIGDVYAHSITERKTQEPEERCRGGGEETMHDYAQKVCELMQPELNCTSVVDLKAMRKVFRCESLSTVNAAQGDDKAKADYTMPKRHRHGRWQKSIQSLYSYKDALVQDLLAIWDIDYDDKKDLSLSYIKAKLEAKKDPQSIVSSWLNSNNMMQQPQQLDQTAAQQSNEIMTTIHNWSPNIKLETSLHINDNDNRSILADDFGTDVCTQLQSTQLHIEEVAQDTANNSSFLMQEESNLLKPMKKKKKYVKGF